MEFPYLQNMALNNLSKYHPTLESNYYRRILWEHRGLGEKSDRGSLPGSEALWGFQPVLPHFHPQGLEEWCLQEFHWLIPSYCRWQLLVLNLLASHEPENATVC